MWFLKNQMEKNTTPKAIEAIPSNTPAQEDRRFRCSIVPSPFLSVPKSIIIIPQTPPARSKSGRCLFRLGLLWICLGPAKPTRVGCMLRRLVPSFGYARLSPGFYQLCRNFPKLSGGASGAPGPWLRGAAVWKREPRRLAPSRLRPKLLGCGRTSPPAPISLLT